MNKPNYNILTPFKRWTIQNFPFIEEDFDAITNYQLLSKICGYLNIIKDNQILLEQANNELIDAFNTLKDYVDNYFENLDVQEEINNKLDQMALDGTLAEIVGQYVQPLINEQNQRIDEQDNQIQQQNQAIINISNDVNSIYDNVDSDLTNVSNQLNTINARIDEITTLEDGSTTGDAELADIRVAYDGVTYDNAGNSVRGQIGCLADLSENLLSLKIHDVRDGYYISNGSGNINANNDYCATIEYIEIDPSAKYMIYNVPNASIEMLMAYYDESKVYISGVVNTNAYYCLLETPATAKYMRISFKKAFKNTVMLTKGQFSKTDEYLPYGIIPKKLNYNVLSLNDCNSLTLGTDGESITDIGSHFVYAHFNSSCKLEFQKNNNVFNSGDFIFGRCKIKCTKDIRDINIQIVGGDSTYYNNQYRQKFDANKEYNLYFRSGNFGTINSTTLKIIFRIFNSEDSNIMISDICFVVNSYKVYYNDETLRTLKNFNTNTFTVGHDLDSHFPDLYSACQIVARCIDVANNPAVIFVKNGVYEPYIGNNEPYAIYKGSNKISIIGESKNGVIIKKTCTNLKQGRIFDGGGECSYENMTIIQDKDNTFVSEYSDSRAYCIHVDSVFNSETEYTTLLKNLKCVNSVNAPIGSGLRNNQTLVYENCELIYNNGLYNTAFYCHAPAEAGDSNCELVVDNCKIYYYKDTGYAMKLDNVEGSLTYANIPCTFTRNAVYSQSGSVVETNFKTTHDITPISSLNNVNDLNY